LLAGGLAAPVQVIAVFDELSLSGGLGGENPWASAPALSEAGASGADAPPSTAGQLSEGAEGLGLGYTELPAARRQWCKSRQHLKSPKLQGMVWVVLTASECWAWQACFLEAYVHSSGGGSPVLLFGLITN
jgi:hypothetical protein